MHIMQQPIAIYERMTRSVHVRLHTYDNHKLNAQLLSTYPVIQ